MPFDFSDKPETGQEDEEQQYQNVGGFMLPVGRSGFMPARNLPAGAMSLGNSEPTSSEPRPTLRTRGEMMAGPGSSPAATPADSAPASPSGADVPSLDAPQSRKPLDTMAQIDRQKMPPAPPSSDTTLGTLIQQRSLAAKPIDPKAIDPATGKPKYRMGFGGRLGGIAANFLSGMAHQGPVKYIGPGATNHQFDVDKDRQAQEVGRLDTEIGQESKVDEQNRKEYEAAVKSAYEEKIGQARQDTAAAQGEASSARTALAEEKARSDKANEDRKAQEDQNTPAPNARPSLQKNPATGKVELMVKTKGGQLVPYSPKTVDEGAMLGDPASKALFYYKYRKEGRGGKDEDNPELNGLSAAEQRDFKNRTRLNDKKIDSLMRSRSDAVLFKQDTKDIDKQLADAQAERDQVRDDILSHRKGGKLQSEAQTRQSTNPQTGRKVGDVVTVKGQKVKVTKILPGGKYEGVAAE